MKQDELLKWYLASIIRYLQHGPKKKQIYHINRSTLIIKADSCEVAFNKASRYGVESEKNWGCSQVMWQGKPATLAFGGVQQVLESMDYFPSEFDLTEINIIEYEIRGKRTLNRFISNLPARVLYLG